MCRITPQGPDKPDTTVLLQGGKEIKTCWEQRRSQLCASPLLCSMHTLTVFRVLVFDFTLKLCQAQLGYLWYGTRVHLTGVAPSVVMSSHPNMPVQGKHWQNRGSP